MNSELEFDDLAPRVTRFAAVVGVAGLVGGIGCALIAEDGAARLLRAYLVNYGYFLSLSLGALFFVLLQHLTRSGWSVVVRRLGETVACNVLPLAVLGIPLLVWSRHLYPWADPEVAHGLPDGKRLWLEAFAVRAVVCFVVWVLLARFFFLTSVRQDATGDVGLTLRMQRISAPAMLAYAVTVTFFAFDLLMSLDPNWYSTIFGVYYFAGGVVGFFALLTLLAMAAQRAGKLTHAITAEHYHDLGKLVLAFTVFWAYIAFSQYMLIWYANIPEETQWLIRRQTGGWAVVSLLLLFGHFAVPFLVLISRPAKRHKGLLAAAAAWVLLMHWVDLHWLVMPGATGRALPDVFEICCLVGLGGLFLAAAAYRLRDRSLIPQRDPRLAESLTFENV